MHLLKNQNQNIKIDWRVEESYRGLLDHHPAIHKVHAINIKNPTKKAGFLKSMG